VAETAKGLAWVPSQSGVKDNRIPRLGVAERASGAVKSVQSICLGPREILEVKILENRARVEDSTPVLALGVQRYIELQPSPRFFFCFFFFNEKNQNSP
jgi:hypothetical protein